MFLMGTSPNLRFHLLHQSNPNCCRCPAAGFLESNRHIEPWLRNAHHIVFLHLCFGIFHKSDNLNKFWILASPWLTLSSQSAQCKFFAKLWWGENRYFALLPLTAVKSFWQHLNLYLKKSMKQSTCLHNIVQIPSAVFSMAQKRNVSILLAFGIWRRMA